MLGFLEFLFLGINSIFGLEMGILQRGVGGPVPRQAGTSWTGGRWQKDPLDALRRPGGSGSKSSKILGC